MKILIVEDEIKLGNYLKQGLTEAGFVVDTAADGLDGQHLALTEKYDLIILDIMLPFVDGLQLIRIIREENISTPILLLSALDKTQDKVKGLDTGADDYLAKPFDFAELLARVRSLLRRKSKDIKPTCVEIGGLSVDLIKRVVSRNGKKIDLTNKEFLLLEFLLSYEGEVVTRSLIASNVWDINFDSDRNVIDTMIKRLRSKIDNDFDKKLIHTVRGIGYILELR
ncbi:MAG: heavy metal response regulator transcription factor [Campylobacteraceae bacterium]|jgi:two-component system copper resistance phosphate regulon response regulator CusR|nr:heavy metal response regulator transcription factor [Campylobacteraceae bacterium]